MHLNWLPVSWVYVYEDDFVGDWWASFSKSMRLRTPSMNGGGKCVIRCRLVGWCIYRGDVIIIVPMFVCLICWLALSLLIAVCACLGQSRPKMNSDIGLYHVRYWCWHVLVFNIANRRLTYVSVWYFINSLKYNHYVVTAFRRQAIIIGVSAFACPEAARKKIV